MSSDVTIVTAYYIIPSKLPSAQYVEWIKNFMKLDKNYVIFTNKETMVKVFKDYPETEKRKYRIVEIDNFTVSAYDWDRDYEKDHEKNVGHSPNLYKIWAEKSFFLKRVIEENPFKSKYFFWNDIGLFRYSNLIGLLKNYPNVSKIEPNKIYMTLVDNFNSLDFKDISTCDERFRYVNRIAGGNFGGQVEAVNKFIKLYSETLEEFSRLNLFKGKDQSLYCWMIIRNPDLFKFVQNVGNKLEWFYLYIYLN